MPKFARDGVSLYYEEAGSGSPPLVLVHGWCCDHTYMAPQFQHLRGRHRVVAVDLRGHGQSDRPEQDYTVASFTDDLAWMCGQLALEKPVVIGHSHGGVIALELAARRPELGGAIVVLDTAVAAPAKVRAGWDALLAKLRTPDYAGAMRQALEANFFLPSDGAAFQARVIAGMLATPHHVLASTFEGLTTWDSIAAASACRLPALNISATHPHANVALFRELCPQLMHAQVAGSGHFLQLVVPEQVNAMIDRFLAIGLR